LNHVITTFIMNQSHGHWLLFDALSTIMTLTIKVKLKWLKWCRFQMG
jgi:hypothetical protein